VLKRCSSSAKRRTFSGSMIAWAMMFPFVDISKIHHYGKAASALS
jgi:hypothetical protein